MQTSLSDLLQPLRTARVDSTFIEIGMDAGVRIGADRGAFLHMLVAGRAQIVAQPGGEPLMLEEPGDYAIVRDARAHMLATAGYDTPIASDYFRSAHDHDGPPTLRFGRGRVGARTLSGHLRVDNSNPLVRALPRTIAITRATSRSHGFVRPDFINALQGPGATALITALFDMLVMHAAREVGLPMFTGEAQLSSAHLRIKLATTLIDANLQRRWSLSLLAAEIGVSRSTFAAEFLEHVGAAPMAYVTAQRMKRAAQSLRSQALSVTEAAWRVGYESPSSFARMFKRHFGTSPAAYQASHTEPRGPSPHRHLHWSAFLDDA